MDRKIENTELRKAKIWKALKYILIAIGLVFIYFMAKQVLKTKAEFTDFHVATVERGDIEHSLTASGIVVPAFEREINAPVNTEIKEIVLPKGTIVKKGDLILKLDKEFTQLEYEKLQDELELKRNNIEKLKLKYDKDLRDLDYQDQIKGLELSELKAQVSDQKRLLKIGGSTSEDLEKAELNLKVATIEKKMLENNLAYAKSVNLNEKRNLELEFRIQDKRLKELYRKLNETSVIAPLDGVITWINEDIGRSVTEGEPLLRIAVLDRFIIEATSSDRNAEKIEVGLPVRVKINKREVLGKISTVLPEVENNTVKFLIELDNEGSEILRPNMRAEVLLILDKKTNVLKVKNGSAFRGANKQDVFVIEEDKAIKKTLIRGLSNSSYIEISNTNGNFNEGDKIIISETSDYDHLDQFIIQKNK